ncbi:hypothetical protein [Halobaculum marinum]|uniref:Uncharacterized protein n=1 Tax=Halobaculum marinum TaxID=3031996 RepID=A0ABD5WRU2_9EURY|nr:hypothetical protein [Halobaculum sp. DT55]
MVEFPDRRRSTVALLLAVAIVATAMLVPVLSGHLAVANTSRVAVTATDATVLDDGARVEVTVRVDNPTTAAVVVRQHPSESGLALFDGDTRVTESRGVAVSGARVPPGGSADLTLTLDAAGDHHPLTSDDVASARLAGSLPIEVVGYRTEVDVGTTVGADS